MTTSFPSGIDARTRPASVDSLGTTGVYLDVVIGDAFDAMEALEAKVGIDGSADVTSHDYKIAQLERGGRVFKARAGIATNVTLASAVENGDTLDGVVLATNDVVALLGQTTAADNGLYKVNASGAPTRIIEFDASAEVLSGTLISISEGTANKDSIWQLTTNAPITIGSTSLVFFPIHLQGTGTPESVVTAPIGARYARTDGSTGTTLYVKESGTGNTGWTPVAASSAASAVACQVSNAGNTSLTSGVTTALTWDTEQVDTDAIHDTGSNTSRLTVPVGKGGKWRIRAQLIFAANTTSTRDTYLKKNGATQVGWTTTPAASVSAAMSTMVQATLTLSAGDYIEAQALQQTGGSLNVFGDTSNGIVGATHFAMEYLGA